MQVLLFESRILPVLGDERALHCAVLAEERHDEKILEADEVAALDDLDVLGYPGLVDH